MLSSCMGLLRRALVAQYSSFQQRFVQAPQVYGSAAILERRQQQQQQLQQQHRLPLAAQSYHHDGSTMFFAGEDGYDYEYLDIQLWSGTCYDDISHPAVPRTIGWIQAMNRNARKPTKANHGKRPCSRYRRRVKRSRFGNPRR